MAGVACQCCDWAGPEEATKAIKDYHERVAPVGECPECGCLCHYSEPTIFAFLKDGIEKIEAGADTLENAALTMLGRLGWGSRLPPLYSGLGALAIDDDGRWVRLAPGALTSLRYKSF